MARDTGGARQRAAAVSALKKQGANADTFTQAYRIFAAKFGEGERAAKVAAKKLGINWDTDRQIRSRGGGSSASTSPVVGTPSTSPTIAGVTPRVVENREEMLRTQFRPNLNQ